MKVLQLGKFFPIRGGVEKVMHDLMLGLSAREVYCDMLCAATEDYPSGTYQINKFARLIVCQTQIKFAATMIAPRMISTLYKISSEYDIIHIHHPDPMATLALFLSGYKGKVVLHWHSDILKQKTLLKLYKPLQNWLIKRADLIVGTTPLYVADSPFLQQVQHKVNYIPIGVDPIVVHPLRVQKIRGQYPGKKIVFSLGRLVEYKGFEYLIKSAAHLDDDYVVLIGGNGPLKQQLTDLIHSLKLVNKVHLLGYVADEDISTYFGACDVFCLSSIMKTEAFAIVQIEAMSCGKPVVTAHIPSSGVSWVNQDTVSGLVVEKENELALANGINEILRNPTLYEILSVGAKHRYQTEFTTAAMLTKCISLYQKL